MRNQSYPPSSLAFDWIMAVLAALLMAGVIQDGWAHAHGLVDQSFFTPWHAIMYSCMALNGALLGIMGLRNLRRGYTFRRGLPFGYWTSLIGVVVFASGGVFDLFWHTFYGIETDITGLVSVSHLWLALGGALVFAGPIRSIAHRYDENEGGWKIAGPVVLCAFAVLALLGFFTQYASPLADNTDEQIIAPNAAGITGGELYSVRANGSLETHLLTLPKRDIFGAAASPDGRFIAYRVQTGASGTALRPSDIYIARADGSHAVRITHSGRHDTQVSWSPDGKRLAYASMPAGTSGNFSIVIVNRDGSDPRKIVDGTTTVQDPAWSPSGKSIVFQSRNGLHQQLAIVPASGGVIRWLPSTLGGSQPSWSRTGLIAFSKDDGTIAATDARDSRLTRLKLQGAQPAFSPDGQRIAYVASAGGAAQIFVAHGGGTHAVNVTQLASQDASHPAWLSNDELVFTAAGRAQPVYTYFGKAYSMDAMIISSLILMGVILLLVRRFRMPLGSMTVLLLLYSAALATQSDTYWDIPAALAAGIFADVMLAALRDRARTGNGFYTFAFTVPLVMCASYIASVYVHDGGLGWPPNMIIGAPFISGFVGLLVSFCFAPPLRVGEPASEPLTFRQTTQLGENLAAGVSPANQ
jgi:cation transporter-like permease